MLVEGQVKKFVDAKADGTCIFRSALLASGKSQDTVDGMYPWLLGLMCNDQVSVRRMATLLFEDEQLVEHEINSCVTKLQNPTLYKNGKSSYPGTLEPLLISFFATVAITVVTDTKGGELLDCGWNSEKLLQQEFPHLPSMEQGHIFLFHHESGQPHSASQSPNHYGALVQQNQKDIPGDAAVYIGGTFSIRADQLNDIRPHHQNDNVDNNGFDDGNVNNDDLDNDIDFDEL